MSAGQQGLQALAVPQKLIDYHSHAHRAQDWLFHYHKQLQTILDKVFTVYNPKGSTGDRCDSCVSSDQICLFVQSDIHFLSGRLLNHPDDIQFLGLVLLLSSGRCWPILEFLF